METAIFTSFQYQNRHHNIKKKVFSLKDLQRTKILSSILEAVDYKKKFIYDILSIWHFLHIVVLVIPPAESVVRALFVSDRIHHV